MADAVGRHLQQVFEEGDTPGDQGGDPPGLVRQVLQVGIPGVIRDGENDLLSKFMRDILILYVE